MVLSGEVVKVLIKTHRLGNCELQKFYTRERERERAREREREREREKKKKKRRESERDRDSERGAQRRCLSSALAPRSISRTKAGTFQQMVRACKSTSYYAV